ncbi:MAG: hypothetical protein ACK41D_09255 [Rubricoccaceae bacterium]
MSITPRLLIATTLLLAGAATAGAQTTVFVEGLGNGLLYSLNAERAITPHLSGRVGVNYVLASTDDLSAELSLIPVMVTAFAGRGTHRAEFGVGTYGVIGTLRDAEGSEFGGNAGGFTSAVGYRYGRPAGGLSLRGTLTASYIPRGGWFYLPGASVGYTFGRR